METVSTERRKTERAIYFCLWITRERSFTNYKEVILWVTLSRPVEKHLYAI